MPEKNIAAAPPHAEKPDEQTSNAPATSTRIPETDIPAEYDRRGIKLPARSRVGGIITPV